ALIRRVADHRRSGLASAGLADFLAVAGILIGAGRAVGNRRMDAGAVGRAGVGRAGIAVVAIGTRRRNAHALPAGRGRAANRARAGGAVGNRRKDAAADRIARIGRAGIVVDAHRRRARSARTVLAGLDAVAGVAVRAGGSVRNRYVIASARVRI